MLYTRTVTRGTCMTYIVRTCSNVRHVITGRPLSPSRDLNLHAWAGKLPQTGLPLLLGSSFGWFSSHTAAFQSFFVTGGCFGVAANAIFMLLVHPKEEALDKTFQCTFLLLQHLLYNAQETD